MSQYVDTLVGADFVHPRVHPSTSVDEPCEAGNTLHSCTVLTGLSPLNAGKRCYLSLYFTPTLLEQTVTPVTNRLIYHLMTV